MGEISTESLSKNRRRGVSTGKPGGGARGRSAKLPPGPTEAPRIDRAGTPPYGTGMRRTIATAAAVALLGLAGLGSAAPPGAPPAASPEPDPTRPGSLDLSIRARSLGLVPPESQGAAALGLEPMKAPTGAGTTRMPSAVTELAPGVYIYVAPACVPGEDPLSPRRPGTSRRR